MSNDEHRSLLNEIVNQLDDQIEYMFSESPFVTVVSLSTLPQLLSVFLPINSTPLSGTTLNIGGFDVTQEVYNSTITSLRERGVEDEHIHEETMVSLLEQLTLNVTPQNSTMMQTDIDNNSKYSKLSSIEPDCKSCAICMINYRKGSVVRTLWCGHNYHKKCIDKCLLQYDKRCPQCRSCVESVNNR